MLVATRKRSIALALTSRTMLRGGRMTQRTSRERFLPKQGGFKTRPYKSPDLCAASRKRGLWASADSIAAQTSLPGKGLQSCCRTAAGAHGLAIAKNNHQK